MKKNPRNKYRNKKTVVYGFSFDSKKEAERFLELRQMLKEKKISNLVLQKEYEVLPENVRHREIIYIADFTYNTPDGKLVVEDVKGYKRGTAYEVFKIKKKLMYHFHKINVIET